jgi:hypothetical protein
MDHHRIVDQHLVEQYLLDEMSPELREEFEDHYFGCSECAAEVRATSAFMDAARSEFKKTEPKSSTSPSDAKPPKIKQNWLFLWREWFAVAAFATCLLIVVYQNTVVYPRLRNEVASLEKPEVLTTVSLVNGNSRGGAIVSAKAGDAQALLLLVDIPTQDRFSDYTCLLYSPNHELLWTVKVSAQDAKDTVAIRVPFANRMDGLYSLAVKGNQAATVSNSGADLATYSFSLNAGATGPGH